MQLGSFFASFTHYRWFDMVRGVDAVHYRGTLLLVWRSNKITFATSVQCCYSVGLSIQRIPCGSSRLKPPKNCCPNA